MNLADLFKSVYELNNFVEILLFVTPILFSGQLIRMFVLFVSPFLILSNILYNYFLPYKIVKDKIPKSLAWHQFKYTSIVSLINVGTGVMLIYLSKIGFLKIYLDFSDYSMAYFIGTLVYMILIHDFYFYWVHRFMHTPFMFKHFHHVHHRGGDTSSMSAFCFHPVEAIINISVVFLQLTIFPVHPFAILAFNLFMMSYNTIGHLGYEFFSKDWVSKRVTDLLVTATHHHMHHRRIGGNYGLYFTWWDRIAGTEFSDYKEVFNLQKEKTKREFYNKELLPQENSI